MTVLAVSTCDPDDRHKAAKKLAEDVFFYCFGKSDVNILRLPSGRPYLDMAGADISVSHSKNLVAVAISMPSDDLSAAHMPNVELFDIIDRIGKVGIDIELVRKDAEKLKRIAKRYFFKSEQDILFNGNEFTHLFTQMWTLKESICKLTGEGLSGIRNADTHNLPDGLYVSNKTIYYSDDRYSLSLVISDR